MRAAYICVNDLSLTVISPAGDTFKGNVYSSGQSATGGNYDSLNVEECVRRNLPEPGTWVVKVYGRNCPQGPQPFALAAIGEIETAGPPALDVGVSAIVAPVDTVDSGVTIAPVVVVTNYGTAEADFTVRLYIGADYEDDADVFLEVGEEDTVEFVDWDALELGAFAVRCTTELDGDEQPGNDLMLDSVCVTAPVGIETETKLPRAFALERAVPSPFGRNTTIRYAIPRQTAATLSVYSATGALVRTLADGARQPGYYSAVWNGRDDSGRLVPSGIYLYRLEAGSYSATGKVLLSR